MCQWKDSFGYVGPIICLCIIHCNIKTLKLEINTYLLIYFLAQVHYILYIDIIKSVQLYAIQTSRLKMALVLIVQIEHDLIWSMPICSLTTEVNNI